MYIESVKTYPEYPEYYECTIVYCPYVPLEYINFTLFATDKKPILKLDDSLFELECK
ncbi:MAG: hypothetical protein ACOCQD_04795 [archaeon]